MAEAPTRALVLGASGLVGGALVNVLEREGFEVTAAARSRASGSMVALDVGDKAAVEALVRRARPQLVFLAVNTPGGVDACERDPSMAQHVNVDGTRHVVDAAKSVGAVIVYYSTDYVFDGSTGPYTEEAAPNPVSVYGRSKAEAERLVRGASDEHLILRTTAVFGWDRQSKNFAMTVWDRLSAGHALEAPNDQLTNPTLAEYLAEVSVRLAQEGARGTFNVVGRDRTSRADLARELAKAMLLSPALVKGVPTAQTGQAAKRPLQGGLVTDKLEKTLGTEALGMGEAMKRFRRHWRADTHAQPIRQVSNAEGDRIKQEILDKVREYHDVVHAKRTFTPGKSRVQYAGRVYGQQEIVNLVDSSLDFWLTMGPWGDAFETRMKKLFGARDFALVNSGSTANLCAIMSLQSRLLGDDALKAGDEVITPAVTFPTTLAPIVHGGMTPVFVDCEIGTYNVDPALVEAAITPKTKAIVIPHTLGNPCDMDVMVRLAEEHDLWLMEDTCDALGGTWRGKPVGTFGDISTISFFPAHHITMGEGGGVVVNNPRLTRIVKSVRDWGRDCWCATGESNSCGKRFGWQMGELPAGYDHKFIYTNIGYNFKPTDMQAAVGIAQLDRLDGFIDARRANFKRLYEALQKHEGKLILPRLDPRANPSWFGLPITVDGGVKRTELVQWLETANIETRQIFGGNILRQPAYVDIPRRVHGTLENSDRIMRDTFFVGVYPGLTPEMIDYMIDRFDAFFARR